MSTKLHTVSLDITTACDQACPDCCCGIHMHRPPIHHGWPYFERAAEVLRGVDRIVVTGGEPTLHPEFGELAAAFRKMFGCRVMTLNSNGWGFRIWPRDIAAHFDWVDWSDYGLDRSPSAELVRRFGGDVRRIDMTRPDAFISRSIRSSNPRPCTRACFRSGSFAYADGKLWGCCVAPGIAGAAGVEPEPLWLSTGPEPSTTERLMAERLPCKDCWFAE